MENIIIIGGGAAGMMTAALLSCDEKTDAVSASGKRGADDLVKGKTGAAFHTFGKGESDAPVTGHKKNIVLLEKNERMGKKIYITGKGRCNLTNACDREEFMRSIVTGERFMYSAFSKFSNYDVMDFFEKRGLLLKTERGNRVFPESDRAQDVIDALERAVRENGVKIRKNSCVAELLIEKNPEMAETEGCEIPGLKESGTDEKRLYSGDEKNTGSSADKKDSSLQINRERTECRTSDNGFPDKSFPEKDGMNSVDDTQNNKGLCQEKVCDKYVNRKQKNNKNRKMNEQKAKAYVVRGVRLSDGTEIPADKVLVATGGLSYPSTGSTGDGYRFARTAGHSITKCYPSLVAFRIKEKFCAEMAGVSLKNIAVTIEKNGNVLHSEFGEMLFTHTGVSGPVILTASSLCGAAAEGALLHLDFKPALDEKTLDDRLLKEFSVSSNRQLKNVLRSLLPASVVPVFAGRLSCGGDIAVNSVTKEQRREITGLLKDFTMEILGLAGYNEAVITKGGIELGEVDPRTMESKKCKGLYFAGEVLDLDALTGGFNLQIAWSTAAAAARAMNS